MNPDVFFTLGLVLAILSVPSFLSALADGRSFRTTIIVVLVASGSLGYAFATKQGGYTLAMVPDVVINTIAGLIK